MKRLAAWASILLLWTPLAAMSGPNMGTNWKEIEMDGALLPLIRVAAEEAALKKLPVEKYKLIIVDDREVVAFLFEGANRPPDVFGAAGNPPAYEIQVRKSDRKVVASSYSR